ncbi:MAG: ZrgA family zinc uptake protein [Psychrobium sp.]
MKTALQAFVALIGIVMIAAPFAGEHVHDKGKVFIVQEHDELQIQFEIPAINVFEFEHRAQTDKQNQRVLAFLDLLAKPERFIEIKDSCQLTRSQERFSEYYLKGEVYKHQHHHDSHAHSDVVFSFHFKCTEMATSFSFNVFEQTHHLHSLTARWITNKGQGTAELSHGNSMLSW